MGSKVLPLKRSFKSTKMDLFAQYRIESVPMICERGTPVPATEVCAVIPSTLYRNRMDVAGSVFNMDRLMKFIESNHEIFEIRNAMAALRNVANHTPDGEERAARFFEKMGILAIDTAASKTRAPIERLDI